MMYWPTNPVQLSLRSMEHEEYFGHRNFMLGELTDHTPPELRGEARGSIFTFKINELNNYVVEKVTSLHPDQNPRDITGEEYFPEPIEAKAFVIGDLNEKSLQTSPSLPKDDLQFLRYLD